MNGVDFLLLAVLCVAVFTGLRRGLIGQFASVGALVGALLCCRIFGGVLTPWVETIVPDSLVHTTLGSYMASIISNAVVYMAVYYLVKIVCGVVRRGVKLMLMGPLDAVLGVVFAVFKWGVGVSLALNLWLALFPESQAVRRSTLGGGVAVETVMELAPWLWNTAGRDILEQPDDETNADAAALEQSNHGN